MRKLIIGLFLLPTALFATESVYCLHGFMRSPDSMQPMANAFRREGYEAWSWCYPSKDRTIQEHADNLVLDLRATADCHPGEPIHFVTHSLGGIIVRAALNHPDCPEEAKKGKAVLLAPPNQGSQFGRALDHVKPVKKLLGENAGRELLTKENFDYVGQFPQSKKVLIISGTFGWNPLIPERNDGKVGVKESCLETSHDHVKVFAGHSWIMYSDSVIDQAVDFIQN
ncbi:MAG: alpha/beta fold hydrolase [Verrucomicrobia bacterium]|nr:alpha/beta fold hydrolase [Verrucomicrobiota bacterium]